MADLDVRVPTAAAAPAAAERATAAARAQLRAQIGTLERQLSDALIACLPYGAAPPAHAAAPVAPAAAATRGPRLLDLGELERSRDELATRLSAARGDLHRRGEHAARARVRLEAMHLEPGRHRFEQVTRAELGEARCGVWQVRPRLGLLGMLMGWWEVKLSSGCPLSRGPPAQRRSIARPWGDAAASGGPRPPQHRRHRRPPRARTPSRGRIARR
jgi:hypothetical protein